jgi:HEAT repeat protein
MLGKALFTFAFVNSLVIGNYVGAQERPRRTYTRADFINIEGGTLSERVDRAFKQFKGSNQGDSVWIAYHFPARDGISIGPFSNTFYYDDGIRLQRREDSANAAVFLLTDATGAQPQFRSIKTLNLSDPYVFENRPVYWLGDGEVGQSIALLESTMSADRQNGELVRGALRAIAAHDSPRVVGLLKDLSTKESNLEVQRSAISNLARVRTDESLAALIDLYDKSTVESLKEEIIGGIARDDSRKATDKLLSIAKNDPNPKMRQRAIRRLSSHGRAWVN